MSGPARIDRREFLRLAAAGFGLAVAPHALAAIAKPRFSTYPFSLGVASGYPLPGGVALWTRLAPRPGEPGGGMPAAVVPVRWEVAEDERFARVLRRGEVRASPDWAHAVHVEVFGLKPGRWYWYRFRAGGEASPVGRTRTAPPADRMPARLRFAFASCQQYEQGYFSAYRHMLDDDLDLIVHLGDYIYESSWGRELVRSHASPEPQTLEDYRLRHALYRGDADLQAAHARYPWIVTWDDHEVDNDYADDRSDNDDERESFLLRRAAAYRAYYEHLPLRRSMMPRGPQMRLHTRLAFGALAQFHLLDGRQYRSHQPCPRPGRGGSNRVEHCPQRLDPQASMLGQAQERWLEAGLAASKARWNILAQQTIMAQLDHKPGDGQLFWTDAWDGYPAARRRLLDQFVAHQVANPVVIGGDVHSFWVNDLKQDFDAAAAPVVASEFVGTSITSQSWPQKENEKLLPDNPHVRYAMSDYRGYTRVEVGPGRMSVDLRALATVKQPGAACSTLASFMVEDGRPGAQRA